MSIVTISPSNQNITISSIDESNNLSISSYNSSSVDISSSLQSISTNIINTIENNNINIVTSDTNNVIVNNNIPIINNLPIPIHTHLSSDITNFNSSVSGLIPVKNIIGSSGINIASSSGIYSISLDTNSIASNNISFITCGRLSLVSNDPTNSNNISSTIYFSPYLGNEISLYDTITQKWKTYQFNEISLTLSPMISDTNYDIFCYYNSSNVVLEKLPWNSSSNRSVSLSYKDGILVKSTDYSKKYLGTIRSINTTSTEDSNNRRFVFNYYNTIPKLLLASDNITHTYSSSIVRPYRNNNTLGLTKVEFVNGIENSFIDLICQSRFVLESNTSSVGISLDSTTAFNTKANNISIFPFGGPAITLDNSCNDSLKPTIGHHYLQLVQSGSSVSTFYNASLKAIFLC